MDTNSIFDLSPAEKLQLVEDLWDDLAATPSNVLVHDWQIEDLERRKANLQSHPASGLSWAEITQRVRRRFKQEEPCPPLGGTNLNGER